MNKGFQFSKSGVWSNVLGRSAVIFGDTQIFSYHGVGQVEASSLAKTSSIRSSVLIEHRLVTDSQTNTDRRRHRHRVIASTRASIVSRGVKLVYVSLTSFGLKLTRPSHLARAPPWGTAHRQIKGALRTVLNGSSSLSTPLICHSPVHRKRHRSTQIT